MGNTFAEFVVSFFLLMFVCTLFVFMFDDYSWKRRIQVSVTISFFLALWISDPTNYS